MSKNYRVGLIVPSSNTTMETEIPAMLNATITEFPEQSFTFHASRMRMKHVSKEELMKMDADSLKCAVELSDARCDVMAYACLIAIMCQGAGYHQNSEKKLFEAANTNGGPAPIISSAGSLIEGIHILGAKKVSIVTPYLKPLTQMVIDYLQDSGIEVIDSISLEVADNLEVGRLDPSRLPEIVKDLNIKGADAVVLSACVQMPSLPSIQKVEDQLGIPVLSASVATVYNILKGLNLETKVPNAGSLLSGKY